MMTEDTVRKRYVFKLISNTTALFLGLVSVTIVPRTLGPSLYGDFNFLLSSLMSILVFMEINTSSAFSIYSSRENEPNENEITFFVVFLLINTVFLISVFFVVLLNINHAVWPGQSVFNIFVMALLVSLIWIGKIVTGYADSKALTVGVEKIGLFLKLFTFLIIVFLFYQKKLNLNNYIIANILNAFLILILSLFWVNKKLLITNIISKRKFNFRFYWDYCYKYCSPLFLYNIFGFVINFFDRWILQISSGSMQQGYYSLAFQIGITINILIVSLNPIYRREIAKYNFRNNVDMIKKVFVKYMRLFYIVSSFLSVIAIFQTDFIIMLVGHKFRGALIPFIILCFYPMYQTYGNLCGEIFLATERTKIYTKLGFLTNMVGLAITYFIMAPRNYFIPGFAMGANGLALKMVIINIFHVHVLLHFVCKLLNLKFLDFIYHQLKVLIILFGFASGANFLVIHLEQVNFIVKLVAFCLIFFSLVGILIFAKSSIIGIEKDFLYNIFFRSNKEIKK